VLSMCYVIFGHVFALAPLQPALNVMTYQQSLKDWPFFSMIPQGVFSVDVFFFLSGFLVFYLLTAKIKEKNGRANYPMIYLHRYLRLTIPVIFLTVFNIWLYDSIGQGNLWNKLTFFFGSHACKSSWWANVLYV